MTPVIETLDELVLDEEEVEDEPLSLPHAESVKGMIKVANHFCILFLFVMSISFYVLRFCIKEL